ncbi:MAG: (d)CMP kinase [Gammaproteobacteria bacterium]
MTENNSPTVITIDGPSGSGKGTISRLLAKELGFRFLDSGALYRLLALEASRQGISLDDEAGLVAVATELNFTFPAEAMEDQVLLFDEDVTLKIRTESIGGKASRVAVLVGVREALLNRQRGFATLPGLVADGRDMGTIVFPNAQAKLFLTASSEERARRRYQQLTEKGVSSNYDSILQEIIARDERDSNRSVAPLAAADDALEIDTSGINANAVLTQVREFVKPRINQV